MSLQSISVARAQTSDRSTLSLIADTLGDAELAVGRDWQTVRLCIARAAALISREPRHHTDKQKPTVQGGLAQWQLRHAIAYIEANLGRVIKLPKLAEAARISRSHFSRAFAISVGCSPQKFIAARRIARAKTLMSSTQDSLGRIADACGFYDQAHFCRNFGQLVGVGPNAWRRQHAQQNQGPFAEPVESELIIIVDDDSRERQRISDLLASRNLASATFESVAEFLRFGNSHAPSCLVLDLSLPDIDWLELKGIIAPMQHPPIVFINGDGDMPSSVRAMSVGADNFLIKPLREESLLKAIDAALDHDRESRHNRDKLAEFQGGHTSRTALEQEVNRVAGRSRLKPAPYLTGDNPGCAAVAKRADLSTPYCLTINVNFEVADFGILYSVSLAVGRKSNSGGSSLTHAISSQRDDLRRERPSLEKSIELKTQGTIRYLASALSTSSVGPGPWSLPANKPPAAAPQYVELVLTVDCNDKSQAIRAEADQLRQTCVVPGVFCSTPIGTDSDIIIKAQIPKTLGVCLPVEHFQTLKDDFDPLGLPSQLTRHVGGIRDEVIYQIGLSIISAMTDKSAAGRMFVETASTTLAARLLQKYCDGGSRQTVEPATDRVDSARMRRALDYISANIEKELTLTQLAQVAGMNVFHFAHTFSRSIGVSPGRYICRKRVEGAMADIAGGKLSLAEISLNAGFSSQASFTRAFHRVTGLTPGEYRAHQR